MQKFDLDEMESKFRAMFAACNFPTENNDPAAKYLAQSCEAFIQVHRIIFTGANDDASVDDMAEWFAAFTANIVIDLFQTVDRADVMAYYSEFADRLLCNLSQQNRGDADLVGETSVDRKEVN